MKCQRCQQREATIAYTHIVDDQKKTLLLCALCMPHQSGLSAKVQAKGQEVPVLVKKVKIEVKNLVKAEAAVSLQCPECGMTYEQFKKAGRLGCRGCYGAFAQPLERLLKRIHGAVEHRGKGPIEARAWQAPEEELERLRAQLKAAVEGEAFERAAQLRDQIRQLEGETGKAPGTRRSAS
jgi:protein arginine kinase activator